MEELPPNLSEDLEKTTQTYLNLNESPKKLRTYENRKLQDNKNVPLISPKKLIPLPDTDSSYVSR